MVFLVQCSNLVLIFPIIILQFHKYDAEIPLDEPVNSIKKITEIDRFERHFSPHCKIIGDSTRLRSKPFSKDNSRPQHFEYKLNPITGDFSRRQIAPEIWSNRCTRLHLVYWTKSQKTTVLKVTFGKIVKTPVIPRRSDSNPFQRTILEPRIWDTSTIRSLEMAVDDQKYQTCRTLLTLHRNQLIHLYYYIIQRGHPGASGPPRVYGLRRKSIISSFKKLKWNNPGVL